MDNGHVAESWKGFASEPEDAVWYQVLFRYQDEHYTISVHCPEQSVGLGEARENGAQKEMLLGA